jgi:hypothetical protein
MEPIQPYRLEDERRAQRLRELTNIEHPTALEGEIAVARLLFEEAVNIGNNHMAVALARTIKQLSEASEVAKFRRGELLSRVAVLGIARGIVEVLAHDLAGRFDGWEEVLEGVNHRLLTVVNDAQNPDPHDIEAKHSM